MVKLLRHRQTKGAETARFTLRPPRHIFTLPIALVHILDSNDCNLEAAIHVGNPFVKFVPAAAIQDKKLIAVSLLHSLSRLCTEFKSFDSKHCIE